MVTLQILKKIFNMIFYALQIPMQLKGFSDDLIAIDKI